MKGYANRARAQGNDNKVDNSEIGRAGIDKRLGMRHKQGEQYHSRHAEHLAQELDRLDGL
jgi:hypothetical protein